MRGITVLKDEGMYRYGPSTQNPNKQCYSTIPKTPTHTGIWDAHPHNSAIIAQAAKCLRVATTAASPIHLPPEARSPVLYLAQREHWTR